MYLAPVTPAECRAARQLLLWSTRKLAAEAGMAPATVTDFESGRRETNPRTIKALQETLEGAGVEFVRRGSLANAQQVAIELADGVLVRLSQKTQP